MNGKGLFLMRILVTNDDGIEAPGLDVLQQIASELSDDVWVVAPETDQSGAAHSLTLHEPIRLRRLGERSYAVKGTPTDCVIMCVRHILQDQKPDLVLSGVNAGHNIADDVTYSGTIAGAIEGTLLRIPSIAMSLAIDYEKRTEIRWQTPMAHGAALIRKLIAGGWPDEVMLNVNFPDVEPEEVRGIGVTAQGKRDQDYLRIIDRTDARGNPYYWLGFNRQSSEPEEGTDLWALRRGLHFRDAAASQFDRYRDLPETEAWSWSRDDVSLRAARGIGDVAKAALMTMTTAADRAAGLVRHLRERGICDPRVLDSVGEVPRDAFVGTEQAAAAYLDIALPIDCGQTISQPYVVSYMTEKLGVEEGHDVLEIGTGSGYQAAILARLCRHLYTIERHAALHDAAAAIFRKLGIGNITAIVGDGTKGWPEPREFDRIIVTAAASSVPDALVAQLKEGGRMILPLGRRLSRQRLVLIEKTAGGLVRQDLLGVRFVPLVS